MQLRKERKKSLKAASSPAATIRSKSAAGQGGQSSTKEQERSQQGEIVKDGKKSRGRKKNQRVGPSEEEIAADAAKWKNYVKQVKQCILRLQRDDHTAYVYSSQRSSNALLTTQYETVLTRIVQHKTQLINILTSLLKENPSHIRYPQLEGDEDESVDLDDIACSVCQEAESETNDIILCDYVGCNRAYHQFCHIPPIVIVGEEDWVCAHCCCILDCIELVDEYTHQESDTVHDVLAYLKASTGNAVNDESESDDEDYCEEEEEEDNENSENDSVGSAIDEDDMSADEITHLLTDAADLTPYTRSRHATAPLEIEVGNFVAMPAKGYYNIGEVILISENDEYVVHIDDKDITFDYEEICKAAKCYQDYCSILNKREKAKQSSQESVEVIDTSNIIESKRAKKSVDYVALNEAMFSDTNADNIDNLFDWSKHKKVKKVKALKDNKTGKVPKKRPEKTTRKTDRNSEKLRKKKKLPHTPTSPISNRFEKSGSPPKTSTVASLNGCITSPVKKRGRPLKQRIISNDDIVSDTTGLTATSKKRGRPLKNAARSINITQQIDGANVAGPNSKIARNKRGRPRKQPKVGNNEAPTAVHMKMDVVTDNALVSIPPAKKRGRPPKTTSADSNFIAGIVTPTNEECN